MQRRAEVRVMLLQDKEGHIATKAPKTGRGALKRNPEVWRHLASRM
jgi:hypothetical protein